MGNRTPIDTGECLYASLYSIYRFGKCDLRQGKRQRKYTNAPRVMGEETDDKKEVALNLVPIDPEGPHTGPSP